MTAITVLQHSYRIARKDLTELFRNRLGLVLLIVMPLFMMVMVGFIYPSNGTITDLKIGVVNEDSGFNGIFAPSQGFLTGLQGINNQTHMLIMTNVSSTADLKDLVQRGELEGGIVIPSNFSQSVISRQQGTIIIVSDESNPQISATIQGALTHVFNAMGQQIAIQNVLPLNATNPLAVIQPSDISHNPRSINWSIQCNGPTVSHTQCIAVECDKPNRSSATIQHPNSRCCFRSPKLL
jgi:ABC-2 type transport system permease protein